MARYIDADALMEEIHRIGGHNLCEWHTIGVKALVDKQPTADVVSRDVAERYLGVIRILERDIKDRDDMIAKKIEEVYPEFMRDYIQCQDELNEIVSDTVRKMQEQIKSRCIEKGIFPVVVKNVIDTVADEMIGGDVNES